MPEINLLQNQLKDTTTTSSQRTAASMWILVVVFSSILAAAVALFFLTRNVNAQSLSLNQGNLALQKKINEEKKNLSDAQAYQAQLSNIDLLLKNHVLLTPALAEIGQFTYQRAQYISIDVSQETGKIHIDGSTDSYEGVGKILLGLSTSPHFRNVKLLNLSPSSGDTNGYSFSIDLTATSDIFIQTPAK